MNQNPKQSSLILSPSACVTLLFICFLSWLKLEDIIPSVVLKAYISLTALSFAMYALDKSSAIKNRRRTPEKILLAIDALGGWMGGLFAQKALGHKNRKKSYQLKFWLFTGLHIALVVMLGLAPQL